MIGSKRVKAVLAASAFFLACGLAFSAPQQDIKEEYFQKTWQDISRISREVGDTAGEREKTTLETITLRQPKYLRLVSKAQNILGDSEITPFVDKAKRLLDKNTEIKKEIDALEIESQAYPAESSWNPLAKTKEYFEKKIQSLNEEFAENENEVSSLKTTISDILRKQGAEITPEQLDYFLVTAEGTDLMKLLSFAENMKNIQASMEVQLKSNPNNLAIGRYYTSMYLVSLEAYSAATEEVVRNFAGYSRKLAAIKEEANINLAESRTLKVSEEERKILTENDGINKRTIEVVDLYRKMLDKRSLRLQKQKRALDKKVAVAQNTYNTLKNSGHLIALIKTADKDFSMILGFSMPELKTIYSQGLMREFAEISARLKEK